MKPVPWPSAFGRTGRELSARFFENDVQGQGFSLTDYPLLVFITHKGENT